MDQNSHVGQEREVHENLVDEANAHVAGEEHVDAMKKYDHRGNNAKDHAEDGTRYQEQVDHHVDGNHNYVDHYVDGEDLKKMDHHVDGGLPLISDSVFSLIIMVYVLLAFFFVFFLFCWRRGAPNNQLGEKVAAIIIFCLQCCLSLIGRYFFCRRKPIILIFFPSFLIVSTSSAGGDPLPAKEWNRPPSGDPTHPTSLPD